MFQNGQLKDGFIIQTAKIKPSAAGGFKKRKLRKTRKSKNHKKHKKSYKSKRHAK
jgi:hypothetical protein